MIDIDKIKEYFLNHVTLAEEFKNILADFLGEEATDYVIEPVPIDTVLRPYTDGGALEQFTFNFGSREYYDDSEKQNIENLDFYERFRKEIEYNNRNHILPDIEGIQTIKCLSNGTIQDNKKGTAKYVIPIRITLLKEV